MLLTAIRPPHRSVNVEWHGSWSPRSEEQAASVARLPMAQRLLLTTDGTVTPALATVVDEPVAVRILDQRAAALAHDDDELGSAAGENVLERRVLLHGARSGAPLLYGASRIVLNRLPFGAREALRSGDGAIGIVLRAHRLETFRVPLCVGMRSACADAVAHLGSGVMCRRRYAINAGGQALMIIDEQFPAGGFEATR